MLFQTIAVNSKGDQVTADDAVRGDDFFCPSCKGVMILRRGKINIAHFAHKNLTPNCKPETVLHLLGKEEVKKIVDKHLSSSEKMEAKFRCLHCQEEHIKDLLEGVSEVQLEKTLGFARPDVSLLSEDGKTEIVVEIVVTHEPEPEVVNLFEKEGVFYIRVDLKDYEDLGHIEEAMLNPHWDYRDGYKGKKFCVIKDNPELFCSKHEWTKDQRRLYIFKFPCLRCHKYTKVAVLNVERPSNMQLPDYFTEEEVKIARREGVLLGQHKFSRNGYSYLVNMCSNCKSLPYSGLRHQTEYAFGDFYDRHPRQVDAQIFETGSTCAECEWEKSWPAKQS